MGYDNERQAQQEFGRRDTLHVNKKRDFNTRGTPPKKSKGHEAFLKGLESGRADVMVKLMDGTLVRGSITHSDKFTITLNCALTAAEADEPHDVLFFKHDISYLYSLTPKTTEVVEVNGNA